MNTRLQEILALVKAGETEQARELLRVELRENPTADAWYLAAYAALSQEQKIAFLQRALDLDPFHRRAHDTLEKLKQSITHATQPEKQGPYLAETRLLDYAVSVFTEQGWKVSLINNSTRQFEKKQQINALAALALIILFNVFGIIIVALSAIGAQTDHITLQTTGRGYLLGASSLHKKQYQVRNIADLDNLAKSGKPAEEKSYRGIITIITLLVIIIILLAIFSKP